MRIAAQGKNPTEAVIERLVDQQLIDDFALARARTIAVEEGKRVDQVVTGLGLVSDDDLARAYTEVLSLTRASDDDFPAEPITNYEFNSAFLEKARVLPLGLRPSEAGESFALAMVDPLDEQAVQGTAFIVKKPILRLVMTPAQFERSFARVYGHSALGGSLSDALVGAEFSAGEVDTLQRLRDQASEAPVVRFVNQLIAEAIEQRASDIHLEPMDGFLRVRTRIDGALNEVESTARGAAAIISRVKILAGLDIAERRLPQDGRIRMAVRGREIDFRVSTVPTAFGESVVLRILDKSQIVLDFSALGFTDTQINTLETITSNPHGIFLVTGPTGSGKTTTLYTSLSGLNSDKSKILTIEDPIEYMLDGINQSQVNTKVGLTFASALRSFLRQDPDIMMVGEIRDLETAQIAVQAALTGHLVLSTLHTNDALGAMTRLVDLGVEDYLIGTTVVGVMAQRLVRTLCPDCREPYPPDAALVARLEAQAGEDVASGPFYRPFGCTSCGDAGYKGRTVIAEIIPMSEEVRDTAFRVRSENAQVLPEGITSMVQDGLEKAARGLTSLEEVLRVTQVY